MTNSRFFAQFAQGFTYLSTHFPEVQFFLTGGVAVWYYVGDHRPFSLDLDFFVSPEDQGSFSSVEFRSFGEKPIFHSHKGILTLENGLTVDLILKQEIVPLATNLHLFLDTTRFSQLPSPCPSLGHNFYVLPCTLLAFLKFFAGRGKAQGKYDVEDAHALLAHPTFSIEEFCGYISYFFPDAPLETQVRERIRGLLSPTFSACAKKLHARLLQG